MPRRTIQNLSYEEIVSVSPKRMSGAPVFTGTRVPVKTLFDYLAAGDSLNDFFKDFPDVTNDQVAGLLKHVGEELSARA